jgi:negative regulator of flagellin synthesis FlgM
MPDPINGVNGVNPLGVASAGQPGLPATTASPLPPETAAAVDTADLTRSENLLSTISGASAAIPPIDRTRVAELQQALNSGTYAPDPQLIAEKIIEIESLLSAGSGG